jgi:hypothetical protein
MGQGRRWLAGVLVLLFAVTCVAGELPDAPSSNFVVERAVSPFEFAELRVAVPPAFDVAEAIALPVVMPMIAPVIAIEKPLPARKKVFDKKFALLAGLAAGLTIADFEMTQRCLHRHTCVEADPLMPTNHAAMYVTNLPLNAALFWWAYRRKEDGKKLWWLAPLTVVGSHAIGVGTNIRFVGK